MLVTKDDISKAIKENGLSGKVVCVHSSLSSFGKVDGGADAVINAFLEEGCTLLAPSFSYDYVLPHAEIIEQNSFEENNQVELHTRVYRSSTDEISSDMGAIPRAMVNRPGRYRGIHAINSFVALGPEAEELINCQTFEDIYAPYKKAIEKGGVIIMIGVGLTKMTAIHYAEQLSGRELFIRWALDENGNQARLREGSCSEGFERLAPVTSGMERQITVGNSLWRIFPIKEAVSAYAEAIRNDSGITHCANPDCIQCNDMEKGGPVGQ